MTPAPSSVSPSDPVASPNPGFTASLSDATNPGFAVAATPPWLRRRFQAGLTASRSGGDTFLRRWPTSLAARGPVTAITST